MPALHTFRFGEEPRRYRGQLTNGRTDSYRVCASPLRYPLNPTAIGVTRASVSDGLTVHAWAGPAFVNHLVLRQNTTCIAYSCRALFSMHNEHLQPTSAMQSCRDSSRRLTR